MEVGSCCCLCGVKNESDHTPWHVEQDLQDQSGLNLWDAGHPFHLLLDRLLLQVRLLWHSPLFVYTSFSLCFIKHCLGQYSLMFYLNLNLLPHNWFFFNIYLHVSYYHFSSCLSCHYAPWKQAWSSWKPGTGDLWPCLWSTSFCCCLKQLQKQQEA